MFIKPAGRLYDKYSTIPTHNLKLGRKEETIIKRLRIEHTHSFFMSQNKPPLCESCGFFLTVNHVIIDCRNLQYYSNKFHTSEQICQILGPNLKTLRT
ncbi:Uncharacterized protein FWK35_00026574 [Aphis craccivora]|uniref:RNase H domain-containing protein n=1 Tax=Aphis craccivora TaxID=307492 RepID=A0A6G0ZHA6_APHCR|nr:Uncharacterized protein FWK35_00026574 [Aphis craccivora]